MSHFGSQFDSQFEENLYQLRRDKLAQIAAIVRAANPSLTDSEAKYPNTFAFTTTVPELRALGEHLSTEDLDAMHLEAAIAGRIVALRVQGKAGFAQILQNGERLQIYVRKDDVGEDLFNLYKLLDLGDHIGVRGYLMRTRTGELTLHAAPTSLPAKVTPAVRVAPLTFLAKAMLALPDKYSGLSDIELRYRRRYLDLFTDTGDTPEATTEGTPTPEAAPTKDLSSRPESERSGDATERPAVAAATELTRLPARDVFVKRAHILRAIRHFFDHRGYLEVETPMLHTIAGGAAARPFKTHHNTLDIPLSLRIAPELYLKRLVVGGLDRVYEINRNFRNEGVSTSHNPEFTMLEFYQAYANYHDLMDLTQELITSVAKEVNGTTITNFNGTEIDLGKWTKLSMREAVSKSWPAEWGAEPSEPNLSSQTNWKSLIIETQNSLALWLRSWRALDDNETIDLSSTFSAVYHNQAYRLNIELRLMGALLDRLDKGEPYGKQVAEIFEWNAEHNLIQPTIIYDFPLAVSPLSKIKPNEPDWVERFEFYIGGFEVGNAFSELNDPDDQRRRFEAQLEDRKRGDDEAMAEVDDDYVRALGYGLPPTAGEGIGIDRLTMILTGSRSIRDVILFPLMRPHKTTTTEAESEEAPKHAHGESAE